MSALDLSRYETTIRRCVATLLHASYTDGIPTETTDAWRTFAADASRDLTAIVTRLRAAEALRDDLRCEVDALQAERLRRRGRLGPRTTTGCGREGAWRMSDRRSYHIRIEDVIMHTEAIDHVSIGDGGDTLDVVMRCGQEYNFFTNDVERLLIAVTRVLNAEKISAD